MNKGLRKHRIDITDYQIRLWGSTFFIDSRSSIDCILQRSTDDELFCFGLQTNLCDDSKEEKVIRLCKEIECKIRELHDYLNENKIN